MTPPLTRPSVVVESCQICGGIDLQSVLFLGYMPLELTKQKPGDRPGEQLSYPAELLHCANCELVQMGLIVDKQILFPPDYAYTSGATQTMRENFEQLAQESVEMLSLGPDDLVVDIGSNDGTLLSNFKTQGQMVQGIEPTGSGKFAIKAGIPTEVGFFERETALVIRNRLGPAALVTATNVLAHIDGIHDVLDAVVELMDQRGVFVCEVHHLQRLLETMQYDTVYHEHLRQFTVHSLLHLLEMHGFEMFHARSISTVGGSIRVYASRKGSWPVQPSVKEMLDGEGSLGSMRSQFATFRRRTTLSKLGLLALLHEIKADGGKIYGIGAPARARTLINYVGIDDGILDCVLELPGSQKLGKYVPGTMILVEDQKRLFDDPPDFALILSWHVADEIIPKLRAKGFLGDFILPLPEARIVKGG